MIKAVITGDIIQSTKMSVTKRNMVFEKLNTKLAQFDKDFKMKSETFRGDSFQCLLHNISDALSVGLLQKMYLRSLTENDSKNIIDARIAIGIGHVDGSSNTNAASYGEAFVISGQLLDKIKNKKQSIAIISEDQYKEELETESILLDTLVSNCSSLQSIVIYYKLLGFTENKIASILNIQQSAVNQRSKLGNWRAIEIMLKRFQKMYSD